MIRLVLFLFLVLFPAGSNKSNDSSFGLQRDNASLTISGTSTLHSWKMQLKTFDCSADFIIKDNRLSEIDQVSFSCKAADLESESSMMDKKAHSALKSDTFPEIKFDITAPSEIKSGNNKYAATVTGLLYLAGKSKTVTVPVSTELSNLNGSNVIIVTGQTELKMSDFGVSPPVLMMGALKTGDAVSVSFSLTFSRN